jgi:hypothetical protein
MDYDFVEGDTGNKLVATCRDKSTKTLIDLTGKAVQLRYKIEDGTLQIKTMAVQEPPTAAKAEYQFGASDLTAGTMQGEVRIQPGQPDQITNLLPFSKRIRAPLS